MKNNAHINARLEDLFEFIDARAYVNIFRQRKDGKEELLRSNKLYNLLADNEFIGNRSIYDARVIGLTVTLGVVVSILIEEA